MNQLKLKTTAPKWFWLAASLGLLWNAFGAFQFIQSVIATQESLMAMGMTEVQAKTMSGYPLWMSMAFAVGTFGGLLGCVFLLLRNKFATPIFTASLVGYIVLYIGDITEGVFAALGKQQVIILTTVVLIAAALLWMSRYFDRQDPLKS